MFKFGDIPRTSSLNLNLQSQEQQAKLSKVAAQAYSRSIFKNRRFSQPIQKQLLNREDQVFDPRDEQDKQVLERELVKNLDNFDNDKIAPQALNLFAQNLQMKLKNATVSSKNQKLTISKQLQQQYQKQEPHSKTQRASQENIGSNGYKEITQANLNLINLQLIMKDPIRFDSEIERKEIEKSLKINSKNQNDKVDKKEELQKYTSLDNHDLFTSEARKALTKYKIYKPKAQTLRNSPERIREVKTTGRIATETEFDCFIYKEPPKELKDEDVMATQMDLYLTINLTENLQKARIKRKQDRMMEEEALKLTKVKGFKDTINTTNLTERMQMETELLNEYKRLRNKIQDLRTNRAKLSAYNTTLYNQLQQVRTENRDQEDQIKKIQAQSKLALEVKMKKSDKPTMIRDFMRFSTEQEHVTKMREERQLKEIYLVKMREQNNERIYYVEQEMEIINQQLKFIKNIQKDHFLKLLKEGKDTRAKGLIWIIECLKELDIVILKDMMPGFIDQASNDFIMQLAYKDYQLSQHRIQLTRKRLQLRQTINPVSMAKIARSQSQTTLNQNDGNFKTISKTSNQYFTNKGFIPISNNQVFQHIISEKNETLRDLRCLLADQKNPYYHPLKTTNQIIAEKISQPVEKIQLSHKKALPEDDEINKLFGKKSNKLVKTSSQMDFENYNALDNPQTFSKKQQFIQFNNHKLHQIMNKHLYQFIFSDNLDLSPITKKLLSLNTNFEQIKSHSIDKQIKTLEIQIKAKEDEIVEFKKVQIRRLVKDYNKYIFLTKIFISYQYTLFFEQLYYTQTLIVNSGNQTLTIRNFSYVYLVIHNGSWSSLNK